jgi:DNA-binding NtrC family response regulator
MALVLSIGSDKTLMETRKMILERAGHSVVSAIDLREAEMACTESRFQVAVIGQNVIPAEKQRAFDLIREKCPTAKILCLYNSATSPVLRGADDWLEVPAKVPGELAERVTKLAR